MQDLVGTRVLIVGRYVWTGLLRAVEHLGAHVFLILDDCEQATWADAEEKREVIAQRVNGARVNISWAENVYPESQCKWAKK